MLVRLLPLESDTFSFLPPPSFMTLSASVRPRNSRGGGATCSHCFWPCIRNHRPMPSVHDGTSGCGPTYLWPHLLHHMHLSGRPCYIPHAPYPMPHMQEGIHHPAHHAHLLVVNGRCRVYWCGGVVVCWWCWWCWWCVVPG